MLAFIVNALDHVEDLIPEKYVDVDKIREHADLPFCGVVYTNDTLISQQI
jgi:hypothetical protein